MRAEPDYAKAFILAADTAVAVGRRILGKPEEGDRATDTLERLRGRNHRVYSAICLITPDDRKRERVVETAHPLPQFLRRRDPRLYRER